MPSQSLVHACVCVCEYAHTFWQDDWYYKDQVHISYMFKRHSQFHHFINWDYLDWLISRDLPFLRYIDGSEAGDGHIDIDWYWYI